jgi:hypothetical protein
MKNKISLIAIAILFSCTAHSQLAVLKMIGKNSENYKMGYGFFTYYDWPVDEAGTQSLRIELLDLGFFPAKDKNRYPDKGYVSIKLGYKKIFSETRTGFYIEPQAGYGRVTTTDGVTTTSGDGLALAAEAGYGLEVGERGHLINFGVKYETDRAGSNNTVSAVALRLSYSFNLFGRREN